MAFRKLGLLVLLMSFCLLVNDAIAQPGGGRGGRGGFGGGFGGGMLGLLQNKDVQSKIDLTDDQIDEIKGMAEGMQERMREAMQDRDFNALRGIMEEAQEEAKDVLLTKQVEKLNQIQNQQRYMRGGQLRISEDFLVEQLGLEEDEAKDVMEGYEKKVAEFREKVAEAAKDLMSSFEKDLPRDARAKFNEMFGEELIQIEQTQRTFGSRGGQGGQGGRGGRGCQEGGRGGRPGGDDF